MSSTGTELPACAETPEVCDGLDNDCDGLVDEGILAPTAHPQVLATKLLPSGDLRLTWGPTAGTTGYDVVRGVLSSLRTSAGDFTASVDSCLGNDVPTANSQDASIPAAGTGYWYLVRPVNACTEPGTYDDSIPPQAGTRDGEIDASPYACPYGFSLTNR